MEERVIVGDTTESNMLTASKMRGRSYIHDAPRSLTAKPVKIVWACQGRHKRRKVNPRHVKVEEMHSSGSTTPQTMTEEENYDIENDIVELFGENGNLPMLASDSGTKELPRNEEIFNVNVLASVYESGAETKGIVSEVLCPHSGVRFPTSPLHNEQSGVLITTFNRDGSFKKQKHFPIVSMMNGYLDSLGIAVSQWKNPFDKWCLENIDDGDAVVCTSLGRTNFQSSHSRTKLLKLNTRNIVCDDKEMFHQVYKSPMHEILLFPTLEKKLCLKLSLESTGPYDPYVIAGIWGSPETGVCLLDTDFKLNNGGEDLLWKDASRMVWPDKKTYWKTVMHPEYRNIRIRESTPVTFVLETPQKGKADDVLEAYGLEVNEQRIIVRVMENSVAHKAGMKQGDIIVTVNGKTVDASLPQMFSVQSKGQTNISVTCRRNTKAEFDAEEMKTIDERAKYLEDSKMERFRWLPCITARLLFSQDGITVERDGVSMAFLPNRPTQRTAFIVRKYTPFHGVSFE